MDFAFCEPGRLDAGDFEVVLAETTLPAPERGIVPAYAFHLRIAESQDKVGQVNLRIGATEHIRRYAGNIGYAVDPEYRGRRFAERAVRLILPIARFHFMTELWICCNPINWPSRKTCERLGAELVEIIDVPPGNDLYDRGDRQTCRYRLHL